MAARTEVDTFKDPKVTVPPPPRPPQKIPLPGAVRLGAVDNEIYARTFFPSTFRRPSPLHSNGRSGMTSNDPTVRFSNQRIFRGGAKDNYRSR